LLYYRIQRVHRTKVVAKDWFGNDVKTGITGRLEFIQETPFSPVKTFVMLKGLNGLVSNYHVHEVIYHIYINVSFLGNASLNEPITKPILNSRHPFQLIELCHVMITLLEDTSTRSTLLNLLQEELQINTKLGTWVESLTN